MSEVVTLPGIQGHGIPANGMTTLVTATGDADNGIKWVVMSTSKYGHPII